MFLRPFSSLPAGVPTSLSHFSPELTFRPGPAPFCPFRHWKGRVRQGEGWILTRRDWDPLLKGSKVASTAAAPPIFVYCVSDKEKQFGKWPLFSCNCKPTRPIKESVLNAIFLLRNWSKQPFSSIVFSGTEYDWSPYNFRFHFYHWSGLF